MSSVTPGAPVPIPPSLETLKSRVQAAQKIEGSAAMQRLFPLLLTIISVLGAVALLSAPGVSEVTRGLSASALAGFAFVSFVVTTCYHGKVTKAERNVVQAQEELTRAKQAQEVVTRIEKLQGRLLSKEDKSELERIFHQWSQNEPWPTYYQEFKKFLTAAVKMQTQTPSEGDKASLKNMGDSLNQLSPTFVDTQRFWVNQKIKKIIGTTYLFNTQMIQEGVYAPASAERVQEGVYGEYLQGLWKLQRVEGGRTESIEGRSYRKVANPGGVISWEIINSATGEARRFSMPLPDTQEEVLALITRLEDSKNQATDAAKQWREEVDAKLFDALRDFTPQGNFSKATEEATSLFQRAAKNPLQGVQEAAALGNVFYDPAKNRRSLLPFPLEEKNQSVATLPPDLLTKATSFFQKPENLGVTTSIDLSLPSGKEGTCTLSWKKETERGVNLSDLVTFTITLADPGGVSHTHEFSYEIDEEITPESVATTLIASGCLEKELLSAQAGWISRSLDEEIYTQLGVGPEVLRPIDVRGIRQRMVNDKEATLALLARAKIELGDKATPEEKRAAIRTTLSLTAAL